MDETTKETKRLVRRMAGQRMRTHNVILAFAFVLVILIFAIINLCVKDKEFSDTENRSLAQKATFSWSNLADGSYFSDLTTHYSDQFFLRDKWISLKLWEESMLCRREAGGVFLCKNDYLMSAPETPSEEAVSATVSAMNTFAESYPEASMRVMIVPGAASILSDYLPGNAPVRDQLQDIKNMESRLSSSITLLDAATPLLAHTDEYIYYKTDHHWTSLGAYYAFCGNAGKMNVIIANSYDIYTVTESFEGTLSSKSGSHATRDSIQVYTPVGFDTEYYVTYPDSSEKICSIYRSDCLEVKDKYTVFFGGNHSIVEIKTTANNDRNLLLFKDSYANCFVQFLIPYYENIIMIDPRYYYDNINTVMNNYGITDVLYLYSADTMLTSTALTDVLSAGTAEGSLVDAVGADAFGSEDTKTMDALPAEDSSLEPESSVIEEPISETP